MLQDLCLRSVTSCSTAATSVGPTQQLHTSGSGGSSRGCCSHHRLWHLSHCHEEEEGDSRDLQPKPPGEGWGKSRDVECDQAATDGEAYLSASHSRGGCASAQIAEHCRYPQASSSGSPCCPSSRQREVACLLLQWTFCAVTTLTEPEAEGDEGEYSECGTLHDLLPGIGWATDKTAYSRVVPGPWDSTNLALAIKQQWGDRSRLDDYNGKHFRAGPNIPHSSTVSCFFVLREWDVEELLIIFPFSGDVLQNSDIVLFWTATSCQGIWYRAMAQSAL